MLAMEDGLVALLIVALGWWIYNKVFAPAPKTGPDPIAVLTLLPTNGYVVDANNAASIDPQLRFLVGDQSVMVPSRTRHPV